MTHDELIAHAIPHRAQTWSEHSDDDCVDSDGEVWPEHDYPPVGEGSECRRCGAEAED